MLTEQFADKPTHGQSSHGLVNCQARQLADWMICGGHLADRKFLQVAFRTII